MSLDPALPIHHDVVDHLNGHVQLVVEEVEEEEVEEDQKEEKEEENGLSVEQKGIHIGLRRLQNETKWWLAYFLSWVEHI